MSGGALDYVYYKVEDAAAVIARNATEPLHTAFAKHLLDVARALKAMEWMLSADTSPGSEAEAIRKVVTAGMELQAAEVTARKAFEELKALLEKLEE